MSENIKIPVIEWSNSEVRAYDPVTGKTTSGRSILDVAPGLNGRQVLLALSRRSSFVRSVRLPDVSRPEMAKILAFQIPNLFPIESGEASVDFLPLEDRNGEGRLAVVAAVRTDVLREALSEAEQAGLKVSRVVPTALSSMTNGTTEGALVGLSSEGLTIDLLSNGGLRTSRVVATTRDASVIHAEVNRTFASAGITPGTVATTGDMVLPGAKTTISDPLAALATTGFDINLELPEKRAKRSALVAKRSRNLALLLWGGAILSIVLVANARIEGQQEIAKEEAKWSTRLAGLRTLDKKTKTISDLAQKQREFMDIAFEPKQPLGDVLTVVTRLSPAKLWLTGATLERGKIMTLRGTSLSSQAVTAFLASLGKQSRFRDVKLVFANNALIEKTPVVNFSMTAHVVGNFPLPTEKGAKK